ncbi:MAG: 4Fe-4S binding protein [Candidatus Aenigmarchaeota archaeon]|nr:4Fe-4S binding protein [Candidatus Aenigmarchaeota archaeon]
MNLLAEAIKRVFSKPSTRKYPKEKPEIPKGFRGRVEWNKDTCIFCMLCAVNCPTNAITINKEEKTWSIDIGKCIFCGRCHDVCPTKPKSVNNSERYELAEYGKEKFNLSFNK